MKTLADAIVQPKISFWKRVLYKSNPMWLLESYRKKKFTRLVHDTEQIYTTLEQCIAARSKTFSTNSQAANKYAMLLETRIGVLTEELSGLQKDSIAFLSSSWCHAAEKIFLTNRIRAISNAIEDSAFFSCLWCRAVGAKLELF